MKKHLMLQKDLEDYTSAELRFDAVSKVAYSVDASIYQVEPLGIVIPKTKRDIIAAVKIANQHNVPVIARGAATGITGGCIGHGLIIDTSKYLNKILEVNYDEEYVICEPGVVQDRLNEVLSSQGYRLGPDTSTGNRATIGGMLANNAAGARSLLYGTMADHVEAVELVLATGEVVFFSSHDQKTLTEKTIYDQIIRTLNTYAEEIIAKFPKIPRRVSGYNLDRLLESPLNISKLIVGSEGTLGIATEIRLKIVKMPKITGLCVVHFQEMTEAMQAIENMLSYSPLALEMIDDKIINMGRLSPTIHNKLEWIQGNPKVVFVAEFEATTQEELDKKLDAFMRDMRSRGIGYAHVISAQPEHVWEVRKAGLGLLLSKRAYNRAVAFIEDIAIPPSNLPSFTEKFLTYLESIGQDAGMYGHVGAGCLHIRPYLDLRKNSERDLMETIMHDVLKLLVEHGGTLSGEHGDGLVRSWLNKELYGEKLYQAFVEVKEIFDPDNRMNPGKIVHAPPLKEHLRPLTDKAVDTFLDFSSEGGFALAVDMCNGDAQCRKKESTMCPSFQASENEYDTTRARAQALRAAIDGHAGLDLTSPEVYDVLELCLECKGCKTECPSQVDMAKMKSEFLYQYQKKHGYTLRTRVFGNIATFNKLTSPFAAIWNHVPLVKQMQSLLGISPKRELPKLAKERFSKWWKKQKRSGPINPKKVVLLNDTFNEYNTPEIGQDAVQVLSALGYDIIVPPWCCCGRPLISKGMLEQAQKKAKALIELLYPYATSGIPIVGLEPSCILTVIDDFEGLATDKKKAQVVSQACTTFDEFIHRHLQDGLLPISLKKQNRLVKAHGHCHQKALVGMRPTLEVLRGVPGFEVSEIPSGCCGMAGSFGYEKEHYDLSMKIGELKLFPGIRGTAPDTLIVANGFSCRSQITHGTGKNAYHLASILSMILDKSV